MSWYDSLERPSWTPPATWFNPVWTGLYLAMAAAAVLVVVEEGLGVAIAVFALQLVLDFAWPVVFFGRRRLWWSAAIIVALVPLVAVCTVLFWDVSPVAGALLVPNLVWVIYAATLNVALAIKN